jgi:hypothetical protein
LAIVSQANGKGGVTPMFDHSHYVPVLRWKRGERLALKAPDPVDRTALTPLLEPLPGYMRPPRRAVHTAAAQDDLLVVVEQIADCWGANPIFVDPGMASDSAFRGTTRGNLERFFGELATTGVHAIPVTRTSFSLVRAGDLEPHRQGTTNELRTA